MKRKTARWFACSLALAIPTACTGGDPAAPPPGGTAACPVPSGAGTTHQGEITADETWSAADNPHLVTFDLSVKRGTLTLEPCVEVRLQPGYGIHVGATAGEPAALVARGETDQTAGGAEVTRPVVFRADDEAARWGSLRALPTGRLDLEHVAISGGGAQATAQNYGGTIVAIGGGGPELARMVRAVAVTIDGSGGLGVNLQSYAAFTEDSQDLVIEGSGQEPSASALSTDYPILVAPPAVQTIPPGTYAGNAVDEIFVFEQSTIDGDETFPARGVPYRMGSGFSASPKRSAAEGGLATLTIEAGVTIKFLQTPGNVWAMTLGTSNGTLAENLWPVRLIARGTAERPIVLTSAAEAPAAGDWGGIEWRAGPQTGNVIQNMRIEYAGGDSGSSGFGCGPGDNDAALIIANWRPDEDFIDGLTVSDSKGGGIVCGWQSDEEGPNLKDGNTFTNIGNACAVARWQSVSPPTCPGNDSTPDCL